MSSLTEVCLLLRRVRSLQFTARTEAATGWQGSGTGTVAVSEPTPDAVVFTEAGIWQPTLAKHPICFSNVFRWLIINESLRLEHLRFGPEKPVHLFDMQLAPDGHWRECSPHQCGEDCYTASLAVEGAQLRVAWSVQGPEKRESIEYRYW